MKILVIRFSSIGDIVLTTPVVRNLKTQLPDAEIHFVTKKAFGGILEANPYLAKVHVLDGPLKNLIKDLRAEKFDLIIDLHNNLRSRIIKLSLRKKAYSFDKLNLEKWLLVKFKWDVLPNRHIVDRYLDTIRGLGIEPDLLGLDYFIPENDVVETSWLPQSHRHEFVAVVVGGAHETKKMPVAKLIELCDKINKPVVLLGGKADAVVAGEIERFFERRESNQPFEEGLKQLGKKTLIFNACGKFNLNQSASLVKQSIAVFTHDTGLMHIAAAFKKRIFSSWGNTVPEFGMYPYKTKFSIFERKDLDCRPCSKIGFEACPKGHFKCMKDQVFDFYL